MLYVKIMIYMALEFFRSVRSAKGTWFDSITAKAMEDSWNVRGAIVGNDLFNIITEMVL